MIQRVKKPGETITKYFYEKLALMQQCKISGEDAVSCIIAGLSNDDQKSNARAGNYRTPQNLFNEFLYLLEDKRQATQKIDSSQGSTKRIQQVDNTRSRDQQVKAGFNKQSIVCYNCKKIGHIARECRVPRKVCGNCNKLGHLRFECRKKSIRRRRNVKVINVSNDSTSYFLKEVTINGVSFKALIDTGSELITVKTHVQELLNLPFDTTQIMTIRSFGGGKTKTLGCSNITLQVDNIEANVDVVVVPDHCQQYPAIIVQPLLNHSSVLALLQNGDIKFFNTAFIELPQISTDEPEKIQIRCVENIILAPNEGHAVPVIASGPQFTDVIIPSLMGGPPVAQYCTLMPQKVTTRPGMIITLYNISEKSISIKNNQWIARCQQVNNMYKAPSEVQNEDSFLSNVHDNGISAQHRSILLDLLRTYIDCFAF